MSTNTETIGELFFLIHPGAIEFSGYGLSVTRGSPQQLVGLLMVDRPHPVSQQWLDKVERRFGAYDLYPMTATGERGIACQMWVVGTSQAYVGKLPGRQARSLQEALYPLLTSPPNPQFDVAWDEQSRLWKSTFHKGEEGSVSSSQARIQIPKFPLGQVVSTPGALSALEESGQLPHEFLYRHVAGDWGEVDEHDRQANDRGVQEGDRLLSAYTTKRGTRLWIITEWDRSVTTLLLPSESTRKEKCGDSISQDAGSS